MPIYEYQCRKCGHRFEAIQKVNDAPLKKCEKCKGRAERVVSSPAIQFKGSGWYITDYARKSSGSEREGSKSESGSKSSEAKKSEDKKKSEKASSSK